MAEEINNYIEKYKQILEDSYDPVFIIDTKGNIGFISKSIKELLGYDQKEIKGKNIKEYLAKEDLSKGINSLKLIKLGQKIINLDLKLIGKNKDVVDVLINSTPVKINNQIVALQGIIHNVSLIKKKEKELEGEKNQLISISNSNEDFIYVCDPITHNILYANKSIKDVFGNNIINKKCYKILQGLDKPCEFCTNNKIFGKNAKKELIWIHHNKKANKQFKCYDRAIYWGDKKLVRYERAVDITKLLKHEEELKKHKKELMQYIDNLETFNGKINPKGEVLIINNKALNSMGLKNNQVIGKKFSELPCWSFDKNLSKKIQKHILNAKKGETIISEELFKVKEGIITIQFRLTPIQDNNNKIEYIIAEGQDISQIKKAETNLKESEKRWASLTKNSNDTILIINNEGRIQYNSQPTLFQNQEPGTGKNILDYINNKEKLKIKTNLKSTLNSKKTINFEINMIENSLKKWYSIKFVPIIFGKETSGVIAFITNISEKKEAEDKLIQKINELEEFKKATINRELRMMELKEENSKLKRNIENYEKQNES